jgi:hypothetical protein
MNSYGYIPQAQASQLREVYPVASPATWTFIRQMSPDPNDVEHFGGVEVEGSFTPTQLAELAALGGGAFSSAGAFTAWRNTFE